MKCSCMLVAVMAVVFMAANSEASITGSDNRSSSMSRHVVSGSMDLKQADSLPASLIGTKLPTAPNFPVASVLLADKDKCPPPASSPAKQELPPVG